MNADATTVSHRNPIASEIAVANGAPRTARLVTASSHSTNVMIVDAANTTAYCCRNDALVKSTSVVPSIAPDNFRTTHAAACAHPFANDPNGSVTVPTVPLPGNDAPPPPPGAQ
ncbi:hypothetical protein GCM10009639_65340 [Kitasatospora putterlickiae]|uniref:Uncharacterized protein n=1 Tax=Kitasatospora putterlickiae TaxID=221725 RepID=A0ABP4J779_9ACTN